MSRWSEQFDKHPIHSVLSEIKSLSLVQGSYIDDEMESERRRFDKFISNVEQVVQDIDPEFYPERPLTQISNALNNDAFRSQIREFTKEHRIESIRAANDHLTSILPNVLQIAESRRAHAPMETIQLIETAHDRFSSKIAEQLRRFEAEIARLTEKSRESHELADNLSSALDTLRDNTNAALAEWERQFSSAETSRDKKFADAELEQRQRSAQSIDRLETEIDAALDQSRDTINRQSSEIIDALKKISSAIESDIQEKHQEILEIHGLVVNDGVAGGYQQNEIRERSAADVWRKISFGMIIASVTWIGIKYFLGFDKNSNGEIEWASVISAISLTLVLLGGAGYASRQSKLHREAEHAMRWFALEVKAFDPFIASLAEGDRSELKKAMTDRLFGNPRAPVPSHHDAADVTVAKSMIESLSSAVTNILKAAQK